MQDVRIRQVTWALAFTVLAPLAVLAQSTAQAADGRMPVETNPLGLALVRQHADVFEPGKPFEITVTISEAAAGQVTAMGLRETLPTDWRMESVAGASGAPPDVAPAPGATGVLQFAWISVPPFPYTFTYAVTPPEGDGGTKIIHGALEYRELGGAHYAAPVMTEARGPDPKPPTITLKGANPATLSVGDTWQEPGYTAMDGKNQDITGKVVVSGTVDSSRASQYSLTYTVTADDGQHSAVTRSVVVNEKAATPQTTPTTGTASPTPVHTPAPPGPSGRERSNPIASLAGKNPVNQAPDSTAAGTAQAEGEAGGAIKRPELPDLSAFRPPPTPQAEDKSPAQPGAAAQTPRTPGPPVVAIAPVAHRAPVPKEMLTAAGLTEKTYKSTAGASAAVAAPKAVAPPHPKLSLQTVAAGVAVIFALLGALGLLGWRLVYSRPLRRRPRAQNPEFRSQKPEEKTKGGRR